MEKPRGPKDLYCPWWKKPMYNVCHTCPLWTMVERKNGDYLEQHWSCAVAFLVPILTESLQAGESTSIEVNKLRNAVVNVGTGVIQLARRGQDLKMLDDGEPELLPSS